MSPKKKKKIRKDVRKKYEKFTLPKLFSTFLNPYISATWLFQISLNSHILFAVLSAIANLFLTIELYKIVLIKSKCKTKAYCAGLRISEDQVSLTKNERHAERKKS